MVLLCDPDVPILFLNGATQAELNAKQTCERGGETFLQV